MQEWPVLNVSRTHLRLPRCKNAPNVKVLYTAAQVRLELLGMLKTMRLTKQVQPVKLLAMKAARMYFKC